MKNLGYEALRRRQQIGKVVETVGSVWTAVTDARDAMISAVDLTSDTKFLLPSWMMAKTRATAAAQVSWLLSVADVRRGASLKAWVWVVEPEIERNKPVEFNLIDSIKHSQKAILKEMLISDAKWELSAGKEMIIKGSYGEIIVNSKLKSIMIDKWLINIDDYNEILVWLKEQIKKDKQRDKDTSEATWWLVWLGIEALIFSAMP